MHRYRLLHVKRASDGGLIPLQDHTMEVSGRDKSTQPDRLSMSTYTNTGWGRTTLHCEVEAIINERPTTKASNDPLDMEPLTPNHLLLLKTKPYLPPVVFRPDDCYARRRWHQVQYMAGMFWKRCTKEYLSYKKDKSGQEKEETSKVKGDIVLIIDNTAPRNVWIIGQIVETFPDSTGHVRQVQVQTSTSVGLSPSLPDTPKLQLDSNPTYITTLPMDNTAHTSLWTVTLTLL